MKNSTVFDCTLIHLPKLENRAGNISPIENWRDVPFAINRIYYLYDIPGGESRGGHAHKDLKQIMIAASGSFDITLDDGKSKRTFNLNRPYLGLYIVPGLWRDLSNFSSGAICLVLASETYSEADYFRNYEDYLEWKLSPF